MTHPTPTAHGRPAVASVNAQYAAEFALLQDVDSEVLTLRGELADSGADLRRALARAEAAEAERDGVLDTKGDLLRQLAAGHARELELNQTISNLRCENSALERDRAALRTILARVVADVMDGAEDPVGPALDLLDQVGELVPAVSRRRLAVAA